MPDQLTPYEGTAPYVFVSFEDSELAEPVIRRLIKMGYRTSFPPIIGDKVLFDADRVKAQVEGCRILLVLCEKSAFRSPYVEWTLKAAAILHKKIVRVDLEAIVDTDMPHNFRFCLHKCLHLKKHEMAEEAFYEELLAGELLHPCREGDTVIPTLEQVLRPTPAPPIPAVFLPQKTSPAVDAEDEKAADRGAKIVALTADGLPKAYEGSEPYIFVSYRHIEKKQAYPIIRRLNEAGYRVWYDEGIRSGEQYWNDVVAEHVKRCTVLIALCSKAFFESEHCREELEYAKKLGHTIHWVDLSRYPEDAIPAGIAMRFNMVQKTAKYELKDDAFYEILFQGRDMVSCLSGGAVPPRSDLPPAKTPRLRRFLQKYGTLLVIVSAALMLVLSIAMGRAKPTSAAQILGGICLTAVFIDTICTLIEHRKQLRIGKILFSILLLILTLFLMLCFLLFILDTTDRPITPAISALLCAFTTATVRVLCRD
ncbi:MAG: toll/interleukin-1 receptor domain-containing protein [Oscillospiraceae bacterium]|nr:toll/interleukin-1 receptor domain-containing protein [Oscillospiraceae bacterium]